VIVILYRGQHTGKERANSIESRRARDMQAVRSEAWPPPVISKRSPQPWHIDTVAAWERSGADSLVHGILAWPQPRHGSFLTHGMLVWWATREIHVGKGTSFHDHLEISGIFHRRVLLVSSSMPVSRNSFRLDTESRPNVEWLRNWLFRCLRFEGARRWETELGEHNDGDRLTVERLEMCVAACSGNEEFPQSWLVSTAATARGGTREN
jgi:hypothetical protein